MLQHTVAVRDRIKQIPILATKTYTGNAPKDSDGKLPLAPFVVIYPADGIDRQTSFTGPRSAQNPRFTLHIVGSSSDNVQTVTKAVKDIFVVNGFGVAPAVPDESTRSLTWSASQPVEWDRDVSPPIPYQVVELSFVSEPA
jgi:hypothetical protein